MNELILNFNTGREVRKLKTEWDELTYSDYLKILENRKIENLEDRIKENIALISRSTRKEVDMFPPNYINGLLPFLIFIDKVDKIKFEEVHEDFKINIGAQSWGKLEHAKIIIAGLNDLNLVFAMPQIVEIYLGDMYDSSIEETKKMLQDFECKNLNTNELTEQLKTLEQQKHQINNFGEMPFIKAFPIAKYFIDQFEAFFKKYTRLNDFKPSTEQINAGIEQLNQYGFFSTLHALAKGNPIIYDDMLALQADNIYQTIVYDFEMSEYQKRLQKQFNKNK